MKQSVSCFWNSAYNGVYGMKLDVLFSITIIFQKNSILSFLIAIIWRKKQYIGYRYFFDNIAHSYIQRNKLIKVFKVSKRSLFNLGNIWSSMSENTQMSTSHQKSIAIEWASKHPLKNWAKENSQGHAQINFPFSTRNGKAVFFNKQENNIFSKFSWSFP